MIRKPPFEPGLMLESEIADFGRLKGRLRELWTVFPRDGQPYTDAREADAPGLSWSRAFDGPLLGRGYDTLQLDVPIAF